MDLEYPTDRSGWVKEDQTNLTDGSGQSKLDLDYPTDRSGRVKVYLTNLTAWSGQSKWIWNIKESGSNNCP